MATGKKIAIDFTPNGCGRMLSGSKLDYIQRYPSNLAVFNANICTKKDGKIWYGDLDLNRDQDDLLLLAKTINQEVFVLREMDGRFSRENAPSFDFDKALARYLPDGKVISDAKQLQQPEAAA